jgi:hypothetical protein
VPFPCILPVFASFDVVSLGFLQENRVQQQKQPYDAFVRYRGSLFSDFVPQSATTGKPFEYTSLYLISYKEETDILNHTPEAKTEKTNAGSPRRGKSDAGSTVPCTQDIFVVARGFTYESVRFCDLDRICDK